MPTKLVKNNETHNYSPFFCIKNAEEHLFLVFLGKKMCFFLSILLHHSLLMKRRLITQMSFHHTHTRRYW